MGGNMDEEMIQYLISIGALEYVFDDEDGEPIYRMTPEAKDFVPDLYDDHIQDFNAMVFSLWTKDMIDVIFDEEGDPMVSINENSENKDLVKDLDREEREVLREVVFIWKRKEEE